MIKRQLSISEFKAHCTEEIRTVENEGGIIELTRHGKPVAVVCKPGDVIVPRPDAKTLRDWMGSLAGSIGFATDYDPEEPAFAPEDWEDHPANRAKP